MLNSSRLAALVSAAVFSLSTLSLLAQSANPLNRQARAIQNYGYGMQKEFQTHYKTISAYNHLSSHLNEVIAGSNKIEFATRSVNIDRLTLIGQVRVMDAQVGHITDLVKDINRGVYGNVSSGLQHVLLKMKSMDLAVKDLERSISQYKYEPKISRPPEEVVNAGVKKVITESRWNKLLDWVGLPKQEEPQQTFKPGHVEEFRR